MTETYRLSNVSPIYTNDFGPTEDLVLKVESDIIEVTGGKTLGRWVHKTTSIQVFFQQPFVKADIALPHLNRQCKDCLLEDKQHSK